MYTLLQQSAIRQLKSDLYAVRVYAIACAICIVALVGCIAVIPAYVLLAPSGTALVPFQVSASSGANVPTDNIPPDQERAAQVLVFAEEHTVSPRESDLFIHMKSVVSSQKNVQIQRLYVSQTVMTVSGVAESRAALLEFQSLLQQDALIAKVDLPLAFLSGLSSGFPFTIQCTLTSQRTAPINQKL